MSAIRFTAQNGLAEARRRIAEVVKSQGDTLDLGGLSLSTIPTEVEALHPLRRLYLGLHASVRQKPHFSLTSSDQKLCNAVSALPAALLSSQPQLELLDLGFNQIGEAGARAIAERLTSLTSLNLADNQVGDGGARAIAERLTSLTSLNLADNQVGDGGARAIAERLTSLTSLDLRYNQVGEAGARAIAGRLTSLTSLDLSNNQVGEAGARAIAERLTSLTSLDLSSNEVGEAGARAIAERLTSLTSLNLRYNRIGEAGARAIAGRLTSLTSLDVAYNQIGEAGARAIAERLTSLTSLNLSSNEVGEAGARAIAEWLTSLTSLDLRYNQIGEAGARAIAERLSGLTSLNLSSNEVGEAGARAIAEWLTSLTSLDLRYNQIGEAGARAIAERLSGLTSLNLSSNEVGEAGARAIAERLTSLTSLNLSSNEVGDGGARAIAERLSGLTSLNLSSNQIGEAGARAIAERLTSLTSLDLASNKIGEAGARAIAEWLTSLTSLDLADNQIGEAGARAIAERLTSLTSLDLASNKIGEAGARAIAERLTSLTNLDLASNKIGEAGARAILVAWSSRAMLTSYSRLNLNDNGDLSALLPAEILTQQDALAILEAWQNLNEAASREGGLRQFNEAKLIVVGDEASGKSSLIRYLKDKQPRIEGHAKTRGIDVVRWTPDRRAVHRSWTLNVWDFAGQEMTFGTHQFFLTRRSLYVLVLNDRKEDDRRALVKWMNTVKNRGGDSPVLIVINQSDKEKHDRVASRAGNWGLGLDEAELQKDPQIAGMLRTSCNNDDYSRDTIAALEEKIVAMLGTSERLAEIRRGVPNEWLRIKERVTREAARDKVLKETRYHEICEEPAGDHEVAAGLDGPPVVDPSRQRAVLGMLDNLGVIVTYGLEDDASPNREKSLLDPNWLTTAFYSLLDSGLIRDQNGEFCREDLSRLLNAKDYPPRDHHFIIDMMQEPEVELAVRFSDGASPRFLVPQALPQLEPGIAVDVFKGELQRFRYRYKYLPPSFMPKFIVKSVAKSYQPPHRWRSGVLLSIDGCPVRVEAVLGPKDTEPRQVEITIAGEKSRRRQALLAVRGFMDQMHYDNPGIEPEPAVPLPDQPELDVEIKLLELKRDRGKLDEPFDVVGANREYTARELLEAGGFEPQPRATTVAQPNNMNHLVILVHGINTSAHWMDKVKPVLETGGFSVEAIGYGEFSVIRFLSPFKSPRDVAIKRVVEQIRDARNEHKKRSGGRDPERMSVISHSFGTYIISRILLEHEFKWHRIIFAGSVVQDSFDFSKATERFDTPLLNHVGTSDYWPAIAASAGWGYGAIGSKGWKRPGVTTSWHHRYRHSDFLTEKFCNSFWIPFLQTGKPREADDPADLPLWIRLVAKLPLRFILPVLPFAVIFVLCVAFARYLGNQ